MTPGAQNYSTSGSGLVQKKTTLDSTFHLISGQCPAPPGVINIFVLPNRNRFSTEIGRGMENETAS